MSDAGRFHTRQYAWRPRGVEFDAAGETPMVLPLDVLHRFVLGRDVKPVAMSNDDIDKQLHDPFASLLLRRGTFPLTLKELLGELDKLRSCSA